MVACGDVPVRVDIDARSNPHQHVLRPSAALAERRKSFGIVAPIEHDQAGIRGDRGHQVGFALSVTVDDELASDKAGTERRSDLSPRRAIRTHTLFLQHS